VGGGETTRVNRKTIVTGRQTRQISFNKKIPWRACARKRGKGGKKKTKAEEQGVSSLERPNKGKGLNHFARAIRGETTKNKT